MKPRSEWAPPLNTKFVCPRCTGMRFGCWLCKGRGWVTRLRQDWWVNLGEPDLEPGRPPTWRRGGEAT